MTTDTGTHGTTDLLGLYRLCLEAKQSSMNGAPTLRLSLLVDAVRGTVTGQGVATGAEYGVTDPPEQAHPIANITGTIHNVPSSPARLTQLMSLKGDSFVTLPPPAIGTIMIPFTASFAMDGAFDGNGGWSIGGEKVEDATICKISCTS